MSAEQKQKSLRDNNKTKEINWHKHWNKWNEMKTANGNGTIEQCCSRISCKWFNFKLYCKSNWIAHKPNDKWDEKM